MKRLFALGLALLGLSGCVSDYPVYDDYEIYDRAPYRPVYAGRPVVIYEDRYRPRPSYPYDRGPTWRADRPRYRDYDQPPIRRYDRPRPIRDRPDLGPPSVRSPSPPVRPDRGRISAGLDRGVGGPAVRPDRGPPRPYIPPRPRD